jgi:general secretion pathway protein A
MYSQHFGLNQDPFSIAPDPHYLFMSERHREALAHLLFGVSGQNNSAGAGGGFVLLTGDIGAGKTTICRCFLEQVPPLCHVAYIFNPKLTVIELLQTVCEEFHITLPATAAVAPTLKNYIDALNAFLLQSHAAGHSCVLIIDEAQNLQADVLEQLRLLTNLETNERKLLQIVLIGQPELRSMLERTELEQLAQRVIARFHLRALSEAETSQYITHRMAVAGLTGPVPFDRKALQRIHELAHGVPRRINLLCGRALLGAWAHGLQQVNRAVVNQASAEVFGTDARRSLLRSPWPVAYLAGGIGLVALATLAWWSMPHDAPAKANPAPVAVRPVVAPSAPAPVISPVMPAPELLDDMDRLLAQLPSDINSAWNALAPSWQLPDNTPDPCAASATQQWQCVRTGRLTLALLRQLGRPGIVSLQGASRVPAYAVLVGLDEQTATLRVGARLHRVRLTALARLWNGEFATYWRAPNGYNSPSPGKSAPALFQELARQLAQLDRTPVLGGTTTALDAALKERVRDFQRAHGLEPDGQPGPLTFMQIESAIGATAPRLQTK